MPFAEAEIPIWIAALVYLAGGLAPTIFLAWDKWGKRRSDASREYYEIRRQSRKDTIEEFKVLLDRQAQDLDDLKKEYRQEIRASVKREQECQDRFTKVDRRAERLEAHVAHLEHELTKAHIDYMPWSEDDSILEGGS